ncbi:hypothetical protein BJF83_20345 [Nocardiopsis sp. CNR-923]|nr:hypothetical protein BJF83_20345 [Nocardiopsis sp. CNR-923]
MPDRLHPPVEAVALVLQERDVPGQGRLPALLRAQDVRDQGSQARAEDGADGAGGAEGPG